MVVSSESHRGGKHALDKNRHLIGRVVLVPTPDGDVVLGLHPLAPGALSILITWAQALPCLALPCSQGPALWHVSC